MKILLILISILFVSAIHAQKDTLRVFFDFDASELSDSDKQSTGNLIDPKSIRILSIEAHCDTTGSESYNMRLAQQRLNSVLEILKANQSHQKVIGEKSAQKATKYDAAYFRRVDIIYEPIQKLKPEENLAKQVDAFIADTTVTTASIDLSILFLPGLPIPTDNSYPELQELLKFMKDHPNIDIHIHGHVCCADDYKLSVDRAYMVLKFLKGNGISGDRMNYSGHSNKKPKISPEVTEADRSANRRVNVVFIKK